MEHIYLNPRFGERWFTFADFYTFIVNKFPSNSHFVELGCWKGMSSAYMAVEIINSNKSIKFDCVDTWKGSDSDEHYNDYYVKNNSLYELFLDNMKPVEGYYNPIRMSSVEASKLYNNNTLDFVFIDAEHVYTAVKQDIEHWLPKIKNGGIIAGHDYNPDQPNMFPGVRQAVQEKFSIDKININFKHNNVWWVQL